MAPRFLLPGLTLLLLAGGAATAADPWTVTLADGTTYEGALVRLAPARYLLQTDDALLELTDDDLDPRTFTVRARQEAVPAQPVHEIRHYDELHADGTVTRWWTRRNVNEGRHAITEYRFGLAPHERGLADQCSYRDGFGNVLVPVYDPPRDQWPLHPDERIQVTLRLPVPVAPGEEWSISGRETAPWIQRRESGLVYRQAGDYAEDNLAWLKICLPQGAAIVSVSPPPSARFTQDDREYIMWRHYFKRGERYPLEVVYTLD